MDRIDLAVEKLLQLAQSRQNADTTATMFTQDALQVIAECGCTLDDMPHIKIMFDVVLNKASQVQTAVQFILLTYEKSLPVSSKN